jgi:lysyl-tRNA synthetase class 2
LRLRARLLAELRAFFAERSILEVETPALGRCGVTDPNLHSLITDSGRDGQRFYLQTSPEFAMKRLLCAGSGPIYQVARAFRDEEYGRLHNPEFTLIEWYRPGLDHHELMAEVEALINRLLGGGPCERISYAEVFERYAGIDPHRADARMLRRQAERLGVNLATDNDAEPGVWLELLLSHCVAPRLGHGRPLFVYDFAACQAALANLRTARDGPPFAERFELFIDGIEVANGCHELADPREQRCRFEADRRRRQSLGLPEVAIDERMLAALSQGLPDCSGVALGFDRLVMIAARLERIEAALAFAIERA